MKRLRPMDSTRTTCGLQEDGCSRPISQTVVRGVLQAVDHGLQAHGVLAQHAQDEGTGGFDVEEKVDREQGAHLSGTP